nr:uncharacterized protein LOC119176996 [Rhipicephalus microplus]
MATAGPFRKKRGLNRTGVTRVLALLTDLLRQQDHDASQVNGHINYLVYKEAIQSKLDGVILVTTDGEIIDHEIGTVQEYNEKILYTMSRAKFRLQELERAARTQTQATEPGHTYLRYLNSADAAGQVKKHSQRSVKLPKLQISTFDGSLHRWQSFCDNFDATIHKNTELPLNEKFKYLLTYLTESAKRAVGGIRLPKLNSDPAIKNLTDRFGHQDLLVNEHVDHLLAESLEKSSSEFSKLRLLHDNVQFHVIALEGF